MLHVPSIALCLFTCLVSIAGAAQKFPYQAAVATDRVEVRCGPGTNYYVTGYVSKEQTVTVYRHEHGGWFMIAPPKGSFSWIEAELVEQDQPGHGIVSLHPEMGGMTRALVRIGSEVSDDHAFYGRELSHGDEVVILGEKTLATSTGSIRMLKIAPPQQEFRWIKGEFVIPVDPHARQQIAQDPYQIPVEMRSTVATQRQQQQAMQQQIAEREAAQRKSQYEKLDQIDRLYAEMMDQDPKFWNLDSLEQQYRQLAASSEQTIGDLVAKRLEVIDRRRGILSRYHDFVQVSAETSRRDQELLAQQLGYSQPTSDVDHAFGSTSAVTRNLTSTSEPESVHPRLNGAGIIKPVANAFGVPRFALVDYQGKLLAYLEIAPTVPIRQWVGQPSGIIGDRSFDPQLGADLIKVQRIVPVRLLQ